MNNKQRKEKIAAVVVTYNRKELLKECLEGLLNQTYPLDAIIVIDNASTDGTPEFLQKNGYLDNLKIDYIRLTENAGGAGGFYEGVKRGCEKGYDWLWLMDDDAEPKTDALEKLSRYFNYKNISALAGSVILKNNEISYTHRGYFNCKNLLNFIIKSTKVVSDKSYKNDYIEIDMASFVGILISTIAIKKIGYPQKEFFIHYDDVEYCIRLRKVGKILLIPNILIIHKDESGKDKIEKNFLGRKLLRIPYNKSWITYYDKRNMIWMSKKYSENRLIFYLGVFKEFIKSTIAVLVYDDYKIKRINLILNAYIDGLRGNFDNEKPKKLLYTN